MGEDTCMDSIGKAIPQNKKYPIAFGLTHIRLHSQHSPSYAPQDQALQKIKGQTRNYPGPALN